MTPDAPDDEYLEPTEDDLRALDTSSPLDQPGAADPSFDIAVASAMRQDAMEEDARVAMGNLGRRIGALYAGLVHEGVDEAEAGMIANTWMRCAVFREVDRETGTHEP